LTLQILVGFGLLFSTVIVTIDIITEATAFDIITEATAFDIITEATAFDIITEATAYCEVSSYFDFY